MQLILPKMLTNIPSCKTDGNVYNTLDTWENQMFVMSFVM